MKNLKFEIDFEELALDELPCEQQELVQTAINATDNANAKYSNFQVGAAIRLGNGIIIKGANQENAVFPLTLCAERTAIFNAQANYPEQPITQIAIAARNANGLLAEPVTPCGSCRQVMLEMEDRYQQPMTVLLYGKSRVYRLKSVKDLLPLCFIDANMR